MRARSTKASASRGDLCIVTGGGLGDAVLLTPALRAARRQRPAAYIEVVCREYYDAEILHRNPHVDRLSLFGAPGANPRRLEMISARYSHVFPNLFLRERAASIIAALLGIELDDPVPELFLSPAEDRAARRLLPARTIVIGPGAGCSQNKLWPMERWRELVARGRGFAFAQIGLRDEPLVPGAADYRGVPIRGSIGLVKHARAYIGCDSFGSHVAAAFDVPAVVLFGPSSPHVAGHDGAVNLWRPPRCAPCLEVLGARTCPYGVECMANITVSDVETALRSQLAKRRRGRTGARATRTSGRDVRTNGRR
jgi:ADP-heptose:LPS heptosyltransferase